MDFSQKTVVITGGTSGIGLAVAKDFLSRGAFIHISGRQAEKMSQAVALLKQDGDAEVDGIICDVRDVNSVNHMVSKVLEKRKQIDILINSAGVAHPGYIQDLELEKYYWMIETNFYGIVHTTKAVLPDMIARRSGCIVNIGSIASYIGLFGYSAYGASKFAVRGFSEALRMEVKPYGIYVGLVLPPDTDTPQLEYENRFKPLELKYLYPDFGVIKPEDVSRAVIRGIEKHQYEIIPDPGFKILLFLYRIFGQYSYSVLDWLLRRAVRRIEREKCGSQ